MSLSSHVLDATRGAAAAGVPISLWWADADGYHQLTQDATDADGRVSGWQTRRGRHRLVFDTGDWWQRAGVAHFHPEVVVTFNVDDPLLHYHVPLLLSPFAYSTYRGS